MNEYSRRLFLRLGGAAVTGGLIPTARGSAHPADFALLRRRWRDVTAGAGFDATAEPYRTRLVQLGGTAAAYRDTMAPTGTSLWPGLAFPSFVQTPVGCRPWPARTRYPGPA